jgi:hypothetical protein
VLKSFQSAAGGEQLFKGSYYACTVERLQKTNKGETMKAKKSWVLSISLVFTLFVMSAVAANEQKITLKPDKAGQGAKGEAAITDGKAGQKEITIAMTGLKPNSVYTVWLVNMKPKMDMLGVGTGDYSFKSDGKGIGKYTATISNPELGKWEMVEIAYHPDGDAKNMKNMQIALSASVKMKKE